MINEVNPQTIIQPEIPVTNHKNTLIGIAIGIGLGVLATACIGYFMFIKPNENKLQTGTNTNQLSGVINLPTEVGVPTNQEKAIPTAVTTIVPDKKGWTVYNGKYFAFQYPSQWRDETVKALGVTQPNVVDTAFIRISENAIFNVDYTSGNFEEYAKSDAVKTSVGGREAFEYQINGVGDPLPVGYSVISYYVKGLGEKLYSITFNGDRKDITDDLIKKVLSGFEFKD